MIRITEKVVIPYEEIRFITSRSSGPGGQHVNTTDTRVTLLFSVEKSNALSQLQKVAVNGKLRRRIDKRGILRVTSQKFRSQKSNKDSAIERFVELMQWALKPVTKRKSTAVPKSAKRRRLERKKQTAQRKKARKTPDVSKEY
ncbi:Peptide chain release factor I [Pseudodesulfovibrio profundus]|uniref:Peptide chain release factor I n=1 Tax=Pseudodesulfovibrio profundus TaxID=57320 RepID=A0A2C8FAY8_9BACT|nr:alternative ribosome rescue aminoacyl-tRNA hydrolase ArfB [Pseudodesulfovibrio profundus]MBC15701.1 aminoacyl-tRNA hydrolase [Desulfovibrio sp.]SOB59714.1 Peptide chain release factor I [Pseudodesulfovibrio profundus]|tara:strand:- start:151 stop:579 length:429 start_codon:yes stop_codon:yes gene_type:complete